ncbi:unnamed protein product [Durusdinium trenchii]|uniref:RecF/RecN/SMC N-terminal domain-containing protein n=1 Tax=Durusdinium trenchii TaxID=1381693 RepID=A0ABP0I8B0_9DINO
MLLKKRRVTAPVGPVTPPAPQPVFLVEDDLEDDSGPFSPFKFPVSGTPESGYLPPNLSYQSLVQAALRPAGSPPKASMPAESQQQTEKRTENAEPSVKAAEPPAEAAEPKVPSSSTKNKRYTEGEARKQSAPVRPAQAKAAPPAKSPAQTASPPATPPAVLPAALPAVTPAAPPAALSAQPAAQSAQPASQPPVQHSEPVQPEPAQAVSLSAPMKFGKGTGKMSELSELPKGCQTRRPKLLCLVDPSLETDVRVADGPTWRGKARARLMSLEVQDFKSFKRRQFQFQGRSLFCFVGCNSSGKSAVLDALRFVLARRCDRSLRSYIRRGKPMATAARVTAQFRYERAEEGTSQGTMLLIREVRVHPDRSLKDAYILQHWVQEEEAELKEVSEEGYLAWLQQALMWGQGDLLLPQFGLMDSRSATGLLAMLPAEIEKVGAEGNTSGSLLKRRCTTKGAARTGPVNARLSREAAEAWLTRRIDEVYRELTREPLDDTLEEWGEGGEAKLRRLPDGSFDLLTSARRGGASSGYGTPLNSLSDGARDICALSMLFVLPGFISGMQEALAPFVVLDEPDSRLDKRHASALRRFLQRPEGPKQCLWLSLNNHQALPGDIKLDDEEADLGESVLEDLENQARAAPKRGPGGRKDVIKARFLSQMSARLREETEAELDEEDPPETL